ncbi:MAG: NAD(P)H-hydrate epimerase [Erysipelotrichaceae bacterium]|nr:NAD(P)H-hydrate epimerase [Erysipelotrichaceae bacterium]
MIFSRKETIEKEKSTGKSETELIDIVGKMCAQKIRELIPTDKKIIIFSYKGNNGQDGLSIASNIQDEYDTTVVFLHDSINYERYHLHCSIIKDNNYNLNDYDVIIDCIFGFSFHLPLRDEFKELFNRINSSNKTVISIDINSGAECDSGKYEDVIYSDYTFVLGVRKTVHELSPELSDEQILIDIFS